MNGHSSHGRGRTTVRERSEANANTLDFELTDTDRLIGVVPWDGRGGMAGEANANILDFE